MNILREHVIVKVPHIFNEETNFKGIGGKKLLMNVLFNPEKHVRCHGIVTSVPAELYNYPLFEEHIGAPRYHDHTPHTMKWTSDIELEVKVGDKVYFHYNCLLPDANGDPGAKYNKLYLFSKKEPNGELWHYFRVKYDLLFCAVRYEPSNSAVEEFDWHKEKELREVTLPNEDGGQTTLHTYTNGIGAEQTYHKRVIMIGSYLFIEPDKETWEDISIAIPETIDGKQIFNADGSPRFKPKEQWLVTKAMPEDKYLRGWVRYCGSPLKGDREFIKPGMYVYFQRFANTSLDFEGNRYFRLRQRYVMGVAPDQIRQHEFV